MEVLTHGLAVSPFSWAFRATRPAPIMTDGFEVLVHEVIEAMVTMPWSSTISSPLRVTPTGSDGRPCEPAEASARTEPSSAKESLAPWGSGGVAPPSATMSRTSSLPLPLWT